MVVIEHGKNYNEATCPFCKCKMGYLNKDICVVAYADNWVHSSRHGYLICPECNRHIYVWGSLDSGYRDVYKLPSGVQERDAIILRYEIHSPY